MPARLLSARRLRGQIGPEPRQLRLPGWDGTARLRLLLGEQGAIKAARPTTGVLSWLP